MFKSEGEGSKGGTVIGHTSGGKPVYASARHPEHKTFSKEDHLEAAHIHHGARERLADEHHKQRNSDGTVSAKHMKKRKQITKEIERHAQQAAYHAAKYEGKGKGSPDQKDFDRMDRKNDPQKRSKAWKKSDSFVYVVDEDDFIEKSFRQGAHKYIKRTGTPGNYKYWYRLPDGRIVEGDDAKQKAGKAEHLNRLVAGKAHGHHGHTDEEIAAKVGTTVEKVRWSRSNMRQSERASGRPHPFERHHLDEAHSDPNHPSYEGHITAATNHEASATPAASAPTRRPRESSGARRSREDAESNRARERAAARAESSTREVDADGVQLPSEADVRSARAAARRERQASRRAEGRPEDASHTSLESSHGTADASRQPGGSVFTSDSAEGARLRVAHRRAGNNPPVDSSGNLVPPAFGVTGSPDTPQALAEMRSGRRTLSGQPVAEAPAAPAQKTQSERIAKLRAKLAEKHGIVLGDTPAPATPATATPAPVPATPEPAPASADAERARALSARAHHPESNPGTPHARELAREVPDFAASEQEVQRSVQAQQNGHNPYLHRAVEIFHRIRGDLKPDRKQAIDHFFQAYDTVQARGEIPTRENVLAVYKAIPGNERKRTLPANELESGTFHTMDEVFDNPTINPELERMKRGYAMKQFQRLKPFLKDSWTTSNPSAPPPMPTFGDLKTWTEHGGPKPSWAGNTRMAVPEEVYNASHKSPDGKPKYPPPWMPIHLMPVWIYAAKSMERASGTSVWETGPSGAPAYAADKTPQRDESSPTGFRIDMGNQARSGQAFRDHGPEGMIVNAMRKYVQMRGGPDQLTDIPSSKLHEAGTSQRDIFKSDMSDAALKKLSTTKIIDPVGLMAALKRELKGTQKSFALVIDAEETYIPGSTLKKSEPQSLTIDVVKSSKIERIKGILSARGRA